MIEVVSDGVVVARFEKPVYITLVSPNGTPQPTDREHADCVSVRGQLYQLPDAVNIDDTLPKATLRDADSGEITDVIADDQRTTSDRLSETACEMESAICELDVMLNDRIAELEMTICELDMKATE